MLQNLLGLEGNIISAETVSQAEADGITYHYHLYNKDIQGSTTSIIDESGTGELSYEYDEFGETTIHGGSGLANEICYTGGIYDESTGLYYLNARYYDPTTGRFLMEDTYRGESGEVEDWHLYVYCTNDPINYVDSSGHAMIATSASTVLISGILVKAGTVILVGGVTVCVVAIVALGVRYAGKQWKKVKVQKTTKKIKTKKKTKQSGKEGAKDAPSWAKQQKYDKNKTADQNATNVMNEKYGKGKWEKKTNTEYSRIKKWLQRSKGYK